LSWLDLLSLPPRLHLDRPWLDWLILSRGPTQDALLRDLTSPGCWSSCLASSAASDDEAEGRNFSPDLEGEEASPSDKSSQLASIEKLSLNLERATALTYLRFRTLGVLGRVIGDVALILPPGDFGRFPRVDLDT
jgi:hypothetical protein